MARVHRRSFISDSKALPRSPNFAERRKPLHAGAEATEMVVQRRNLINRTLTKRFSVNRPYSPAPVMSMRASAMLLVEMQSGGPDLTDSSRPPTVGFGSIISYGMRRSACQPGSAGLSRRANIRVPETGRWGGRPGDPVRNLPFALRYRHSMAASTPAAFRCSPATFCAVGDRAAVGSRTRGRLCASATFPTPDPPAAAG